MPLPPPISMMRLKGESHTPRAPAMAMRLVKPAIAASKLASSVRVLSDVVEGIHAQHAAEGRFAGSTLQEICPSRA